MTEHDWKVCTAVCVCVFCVCLGLSVERLGSSIGTAGEGGRSVLPL